jgi:chitinase
VGYQRSLYPETTVDFTYMTHIIVGAIQATPTGGVTTDFWVDNTNGPIMARTLSTRAHQAGRKALLMLGGAGYRTNLVSATSNTYRAAFVANLLRTMDDLGYDGIDVDWEPVLDSDKPQVLAFLRELRAARPNILLTFPISWVNANWGADPWYAQVAGLVDQLNVMSYQMADNWGGWVSWHSGALHGEGGNRPSSVASTARAYQAVGIPAAKLGIGIGAYGSCWRGVNGMYKSLDGTSATIVAHDNVMSFTNIMTQYYSSAAYQWDDAAKSGFLSFAAPTGPQGCTMVSFEDERSVAEKGAFVRNGGAGGAIVWTIQQGRLPNAPAGSQDPLLSATYRAMMQ